MYEIVFTYFLAVSYKSSVWQLCHYYWKLKKMLLGKTFMKSLEFAALSACLCVCLSVCLQFTLIFKGIDKMCF